MKAKTGSQKLDCFIGFPFFNLWCVSLIKAQQNKPIPISKHITRYVAFVLTLENNGFRLNLSEFPVATSVYKLG